VFIGTYVHVGSLWTSHAEILWNCSDKEAACRYEMIRMYVSLRYLCLYSVESIMRTKIFLYRDRKIVVL
jgi:hypothetical protein